MTHFVSYSALQSIFCSPVLGFLCLSFMACGFTIGIDSNPHLEDWQGMSNTFNLGGLAGEALGRGTMPSLRTEGNLKPTFAPSSRGAGYPAYPPGFSQVGVTVAY